MSSEVYRLKEELRRKEEEPSLNSYDPNGPQALQRKIGKKIQFFRTKTYLSADYVASLFSHSE